MRRDLPVLVSLQVIPIDHYRPFYSADFYMMTGSIAATIQSAVYGAYIGGLFSVLQSIGATAVVASPLALGLGAATLGTGLICKLSGRGRPSNAGGDDDGNDGDYHYGNSICYCTSCTDEGY
jgi:hypothetical protein